MSDVLGVCERSEIQGEVATLADEYAARMLDALDHAETREQAKVALAGAFLSFLADAVLLIQSAA